MINGTVAPRRPYLVQLPPVVKFDSSNYAAFEAPSLALVTLFTLMLVGTS